MIFERLGHIFLSPQPMLIFLFLQLHRAGGIIELTIDANKIEQVLNYRKESFPKSVSTTLSLIVGFIYLPLMLVSCSFCRKADLNRQFGDIAAETKRLVLSTIRQILNKSDQMALCVQETAWMYNLWTACLNQESKGSLTQMISTCIFS